MKKRFVAIMLMMSMVALAACGNNADVNKSSEKKEESKKEESKTEDKAEESSEEAEESKWPEYLNMEGPYPIIKEGYEEEVKLTAWVKTEVDFNDTWLCQYLKEKYNINLEVESIPAAARSERKQLAFNGGDLPDIFIGMGINPTEVMNYGVAEDLFLPMDEYISEELTPGIWAFMYGEHADIYGEPMAQCFAADGHMYTLPYLIDARNPSANLTMPIRKSVLDDLNIEMPETLDDFTDMLYKVKEADPFGVGSENMYPFGGGMTASSNVAHLLQAMGYVVWSSACYGETPAIRNGEVVIPAYDIDVYAEYLKLLNQYYNDGLISPDFFTLESAEVNNMVLSGQSITSRTDPASLGMDVKEWSILPPLTSEWNDTPLAGAGALVDTGQLVISADTEHPEACMRFIDTFFNTILDDPYAYWVGSPEYAMDWVVGTFSEEINDYELVGLPDGVGVVTYLVEQLIGFYPQLGACWTAEARERHAELDGIDWTYEYADHLSQIKKEVVSPHVVSGFPYTYYMDAETQQIATDLETVIRPYIKEQAALFITGERPLSETAEFAEELKGMGIEDLIKIYDEIYANYQAALSK